MAYFTSPEANSATNGYSLTDHLHTHISHPILGWDQPSLQSTQAKQKSLQKPRGIKSCDFLTKELAHFYQAASDSHSFNCSHLIQ